MFPICNDPLVRPPAARRVQHGTYCGRTRVYDAWSSRDDADPHNERVVFDVQRKKLRCGWY